MTLEEKLKSEVLKLEGPVAIFGAGGFIGTNLLRKILKYRADVFAVTSKPYINWRLDDIDQKQILHIRLQTKPIRKEKLF